jgi:hypothetical protein
MAKVETNLTQEEIDNWREFYRTDYVSSGSIVRAINQTSYPGRCGKVKRAPTLAELEGDDNNDSDYYSRDDSHYEERDR